MTAAPGSGQILNIVLELWSRSSLSASVAAVSLACFGEPPSALAAGRAVPADQARRDAAEAAGLGDGGPRGEPVGAVRAVGAAPRPGLAVPRESFRLGAALPAGAWPTCP